MTKKLLDKNLSAQLSALVPRIVHDVEFVVSLDEREASAELELLLEDVASLSNKISVRRDDEANQRKPGFQIRRVNSEIAVTFAGIPMGHEFSSFVLALLQVGGNPIKEDPEVIERVKNLPGDFNFVTYMSLSCQNCPTVVQALNTMSIINPRIKHTAVEGSLFQDEIDELKILSVPAIYLDGELFSSGRATIEDFLAKLDENDSTIAAEKLSSLEPFDVLVVGQGPAGASAAIYAARKGLRTGIIGDRFGGQVNDTMAIENYISQPYTEGPKLARELQAHVASYPIEIINSQTATGLIPADTPDGNHTVEVGEAKLSAKQVILATGANWRLLNVPGEEEYRNKGVTFCPHCDAPLFKGKPVAVVGGGNSGIEAAIDIAVYASHVTVVEFMPECRADEVLLEKLNALPNTSVVTNAATKEIAGDGHQVTGLVYTDRSTGEPKRIDVSGVFIQIGLLPNTAWLAETCELNIKKEIVTDGCGRTSIPGIYAAGDCADTAYKQIVVAQSSGATAALAAWDDLVRAG